MASIPVSTPDLIQDLDGEITGITATIGAGATTGTQASTGASAEDFIPAGTIHGTAPLSVSDGEDLLVTTDGAIHFGAIIMATTIPGLATTGVGAIIGAVEIPSSSTIGTTIITDQTEIYTTDQDPAHTVIHPMEMAIYSPIPAILPVRILHLQNRAPFLFKTIPA